MARMKMSAEELRKRRRAHELKRKRSEAEQGSDDGADKGDCVCAICDNGGTVTCCGGVCKRSFHLDESEGSTCRLALGLTKDEAKTILDSDEDFVCKNCEYRQHQCFACGFLGSSDLSSWETEVFQCKHDDCGRFYHPKCVANLLYPDAEEEAALFEQEVAARLEFACPMHECCVCREGENKEVEDLQFAVCRRCPTTYHRKCLPEEIRFRTKKGPNGAMRRAWDDVLPDRILIYCMKHDIVRKLKTAPRDHIVFPVAEKLGAAKSPEYCYSPMEKQDVAEGDDEHYWQWQPFSEPPPSPPVPASNKNQSFSEVAEQYWQPFSEPPPSPPAPASNEKQCFSEGAEQTGLPFLGTSEPPLQPATASNKKQCFCSGHMDSFAPKSLFMHPQPGSCGWIDDDE